MNTDITPQLIPKLKELYINVLQVIENNYILSLITILAVCIGLVVCTLFINNEKKKSLMVSLTSIIIAIFISISFVILINMYFSDSKNLQKNNHSIDMGLML
ncbi:hypothetical protein M4L39_13645 [Staphylococcus equorum]|uniref:hypothetical protein n=1 Tax=Staphylococcus equorum TaxID=246432 RepID=UPI002407EDE9|nr:hypothetical protein [Staphylococcus equorum]MDG0844457.1 hypothetical protein [Staphylococcus equorum]